MSCEFPQPQPAGIVGPADAQGILARHEKRLLARIRRMMGPEAREGAESGDVLQSVYADALSSLSTGRLEGHHLLPWMTEVARHKIVDEVRRRRERPMSVSSADVPSAAQTSPVTQLFEGETERALLEALARLDPEHRRVVTLRCEEGLSWLEVARVVGRTEEAARKLYHRALLELGQCLALRKLEPDRRSAG